MLSTPKLSFFFAAIVVVFEVKVSGQDTGIKQDDFAFLSYWSSLTVDKLKTFEAVAGKDKLLKDLTSTAFKQKVLSWPLLTKILRLRSSTNLSQSSIPSNLLAQPDHLLLTFTATQLLKATNETSELNVTQEVLKSVASKHLTYGQAGVLVDAFLTKSAGKRDQVPSSYSFATPSDALLKDPNLNESAVLRSSEKLFPSQQFAFYKRMASSKDNIAKFVAQVTSDDVAELILEFMPVSVFKSNLNIIREELAKLPSDKLGNVVNYPKHLLSAWQEDIQASSGLLATLPNLSLRGMTCASLQSADVSMIPDVIDAYNKFVLQKHPDRLKTLPLSLRKCFVEALKKYLKFIVSSSNTTTSDSQLLNNLQLTEVPKIGGHVLSGLKPSEVEAISNRDLQREVLRAIGDVPMAELMPLVHMERLQNLTNIYMKNVSTLTDKDFDTLGSLAFFMQPTKWGLASAPAIRSFVESTLTKAHQKCICLPKGLSEALESALIKAYGDISTWKASTLVALDEIIMVMEETTTNGFKAETLVSALPYLIQNKSMHDRHYDSFPGFIGPVSFDKACESWLDVDSDSMFHRASNLRMMRNVLRAAQLAINLANSEESSRVRRQVKTMSELTDDMTTKLHAKAAAILFSRYENNSLTIEQQTALRKMVEEIENKTMAVIYKALNVTSMPSGDLQAAISNGYNTGDITVEELADITQVAKDGQKLYVVRVTEILGLTAKDLEIDEFLFCQFTGKPCPTTTTLKIASPSITTTTTTQKVFSTTTKPSVSLVSSQSTSQSPPKVVSSSITTSTTASAEPSILTTTTTTTATTTATTVTTLPSLVIDHTSFIFTGFVQTINVKVTETLPDKLTCQGILAAGWAASAVTARDLDSWTPQQIYNCIEVLGSIEWPSQSVAVDIWNVVASKMSIPKSGSMMILLRNLLEPAAIKNVNNLAFNLNESLEPLSLLANFDLPNDTVKAVGEKIALVNKLDLSIPTSITALKQFICALPIATVDSLFKSASDRLSLIHVLGSMRSCSNYKVLEFLATQAKQEIPMPWKTSEAQSLGIILAGLQPSELAAQVNETLNGLTPSAVFHLTPDHIKELSAEKLSAIPPESMSVLRITQLPKDGASVLDPNQMLVLESHVDSSMPLARMIRQYQTMNLERSIQAKDVSQQAAAAVTGIRTNSASKNLFSILCLSMSFIFAVAFM